MTQTRIYVPLDAAGLRTLARDGRLGAPPVTACAVTAAVERAFPGADLEELEYAALCDAVDLAGALRAGPGDRRVVAAADVEEAWVGAHSGERSDIPSLVHVSHPVELAQVVSLHVDEDGAGGDDELLWYDVTELSQVVASF